MARTFNPNIFHLNDVRPATALVQELIDLQEYLNNEFDMKSQAMPLNEYAMHDLEQDFELAKAVDLILDFIDSDDYIKATRESAMRSQTIVPMGEKDAEAS